MTRAKLRAARSGALDELNPLTLREGPLTILERFLERTGHGARPHRRRHARVEADGRQHRELHALRGRLAGGATRAGRWPGFVDYLDAYQAAGGELPTSVELTEDVEGVRLMTLYQAKGLEFPIVFVPQLLEESGRRARAAAACSRASSCARPCPTGDIHTDEERRLLYVAMTRAQERLILTTHGGPAATKEPSRFVGELLDGAGEELRGSTGPGEHDRRRAGERLRAADEAEPRSTRRGRAAIAAVRRVMPLPTARERRLALRLRASELVGLMEATAGADPEARGARDGVRRASSPTSAASAATTADAGARRTASTR